MGDLRDSESLHRREFRANLLQAPQAGPSNVIPFALILTLALTWRLVIAWQMPVIARDGVGFCWNARELGRNGLAALKSPEFSQHPLFAACILGLQRAAVLLGLPSTPHIWQLCGQVVSLTCGLLVVVLSGVLATRVARAVSTEAPPPRVAAVAMLLAAILPLNVWLSVDVMSEQLFFVWYLGAATLLLGSWSASRAATFGVLVGLAFLTRPEGAAIGVAGAVAVFARRSTLGRGRSAVCLALMAAGYLVTAAPYWMVLGRFSNKEDKQTIEEVIPATAELLGLPSFELATHERQGPTLSFAAVTRERYPIYQAAGVALLETVRAGRGVVFLAGLPALWLLRKKILGPMLIGLFTAASLHFALTVILIYRHGYLSPRHTLAVVMLVLPWAALTLEHLWRLGLRGNRVIGILLCSAVFGVLAGYSLRVPNQGDSHLRTAAGWLNGLRDKEPEWILVGGDSLKRVAFYADIGIRDWNEEAATVKLRAASIIARLRDDRPPARFFGIETDFDAQPGDEPYGNDLLLKELRKDPEIGPRMHSVFEVTRSGGGTLVIFEIR